VWVLRDGKPVRVSLKTGITDGSQTEIVDGEIKEGDLVITDVTMGTSAPKAPSSAATQNNLPRRMF
jgi:HlyD family secretion protein